MRHRWVTAGAVWMFAWASIVPGAPDPNEATKVAGEYLEAIRAKGFAGEADFMHPDELVRFQGMLLPVLAAEEAAGSRALLNATFGRHAAMLDARLADPADFMRRFARVMAVRLPDQPVGFDELQVLGTVTEEERAHVLVRLRTAAGEVAAEELVVVSLLPFQDEWKLMLGPKLEAAVRAMDSSGQERRPAPRLVPRPPPPPSQPAETGR